MKTKTEIKEIKDEITEIMDDFFVDLFDEGFKIGHDSNWRQLSICISHKSKFKISTVQSKILMFIEYLKSQYTHISYELKSNKQKFSFKHFPLFFYKEITEFKILITI